MPESPTEIKPPPPPPVILSSTSPASLPQGPPPPTGGMGRPMSAGSAASGHVNGGAHSPQSTLSGRTPSPPSLGSAHLAQQLPPACGARQLSKLKRFLTTLIQFGTDISPEIGERVRSLVRALVNNHLSIEEFHSKLQEATNFPLRPFVIPFLKTNLPLLQRELLHCARMARQTPQQYLAHNEHVIFDPSRPSPVIAGGVENQPHHSPVETARAGIQAESPGSAGSSVNENGKRVRSPDRLKENGDIEGGIHPAKRPHSLSPGSSARISPGSGGYPGGGQSGGGSGAEDGLHRLERERYERERGGERDRHVSPYGYTRHTEQYDSHFERAEDEWKHLENMLHCVMDMVGRCRQALTALQERTRREREDLARWVRQHNGVDPEVKKRADYMTESLRHTEDRVTEVRRRAVHVFPEEAVNEVKRQAMLELQKAVAAAEAKAGEMVAGERLKMEHAVAEARKQVRDEVVASVNRQEESPESCWNCGRVASETCSGCNVARYCGSFCQHKDWETHHHVCGQQGDAPAATTTAAAAVKTQQPEAAAEGEQKKDSSPNSPTTTVVAPQSPNQAQGSNNSIIKSSPMSSPITTSPIGAGRNSPCESRNTNSNSPIIMIPQERVTPIDAKV